MTPVKVLTVGDGDLTLSLALVRAYGPKQISLTASTLVQSKTELCKTYGNSRAVLEELEDKFLVPIRFGTDATQLHSVFKEKFDAILFHHPHLGLDTLIEDEEWHAKRHRILLDHYFWSAQQILTLNGRVHVCLCGTQPHTWQLMEAAKHQGLALVQTVPTAQPEWLAPNLQLSRVETHYPAPRKYRNGKLGSKHIMGKYGYRHRRTYGDRVAGDINVSASHHFFFKRQPNSDTNQPRTSSRDGDYKCEICSSIFDTHEELGRHLKQPAVPDPLETLQTIHEQKKQRICTAEGLDSKANQSGNHVEDPGPDEKAWETVISGNAAGKELWSGEVSREFEGSRLRWYLRQEPKASAVLSFSKKQCDDCVKVGRVFVDGFAVLDSSRILHEGSQVCVYGAAETIEFVTQKLTIVRTLGDVVVVDKPVGMRAVGSFSDQTLESAASQQLGATFKCLTNLDTGCGGLCLLQKEGSGECVDSIKAVFRALVFGEVAWDRMEMSLPQQARRWGKSKEVFNGPVAMPLQHSGLDDDDGNVVDHENGQVQDKKRRSVLVRCLETVCGGVDNVKHALSTVEVEIPGPFSSGLCNSVCYVLRKKGFGVVNDRFCRKEYLQLPRSIRNIIKNRLCIGCYRIEWEQGGHQIATIQPPLRVSAHHWKDYISPNRQS